MVEQGKSLKKELRSLEEKLYARTQNILDTTGTIVEKIRTMSATQSPYENLLEILRDPELVNSERDIQGLQQTVRRLEEEYDRARKQVEKHTVEGKDFKPLESETASLIQTLIERQTSHAEKLAHLQHKHDAAKALYSSRANHIIADLKRIASDREIEQMSSLSMDVVKYNRLLRREVENVRREGAIVMSLVQALDTENIRLVASSAGADWNLGGVMVGHDDEDEDECEGKADGNLSSDSESDSDWVSDSESGDGSQIDQVEGMDQDILVANDKRTEDEARIHEIGTGKQPPKQSRNGILPASRNAGEACQQDYQRSCSFLSEKSAHSQIPPPVPRTVADLAQNREAPISPTVSEQKRTRLAPLPDNTRFSAATVRSQKRQSSSSSLSSNSSSCKVTAQPIAPQARKSPFRIAPLRYHNLETFNAQSVLRAEETEIPLSGTRSALALEGTAVKLTDEAPTGGARFYTSRFVASLQAL